MSQTVHIRPLAAADFAAWLPLWQGYLDFYHSSQSEADTAITWQRFLDPAEPMQAWLAWQGEQAVGLVHTVLHRSSWTPGNYCYLQDLFVQPEVRGTGAGRALIEQVYAYAADVGCSRVYWLTHESNAPARQLYDRLADNLGFIQYRKQVG